MNQVTTTLFIRTGQTYFGWKLVACHNGTHEKVPFGLPRKDKDRIWSQSKLPEARGPSKSVNPESGQ